MKNRIIDLIIVVGVFGFAYKCIGAAVEPVISPMVLNATQAKGAEKIANAIVDDDNFSIPELFSRYFEDGIIIYDDPGQALHLILSLRTAVINNLKARGNEQLKFFINGTNQAGRTFSQLINDNKKNLEEAYEAQQLKSPILGEPQKIGTATKNQPQSLPCFHIAQEEKGSKSECALYQVKNWHKGSVIAIAISTDGSMLASVGKNDNEIKLMNLKTHEIINKFSDSTLEGSAFAVSEVPYSMVFSPNEKQLASLLSDSYLRLWDIQTGTMKSKIFLNKRNISLLQFLSDDTLLVAVLGFKNVELWKVNTMTAVTHATAHFEVTMTPIIEDGILSRDGKMLSIKMLDGSLMIYNMETKQSINIKSEKESTARESTTKFGYNPLAFSFDGNILACYAGDGFIKFLTVNSGTIINEIKLESIGKITISAASFSPNGKTFVIGDSDGNIAVLPIQK